MSATIYPNPQFLLMGVVFAGIVLGVVLNIAFGGFKVGKLERRLEVAVPHEQFPAFLTRMNQRLSELGFRGAAPTGPYTQSGQEFLVPTSHTHAKVPKTLEVAADETNPQAVKVALTVRYQDLIVGDTGESAYADAVMQYLTNGTDAIKPVANRSFMAFSSLVLGIWVWVVMAALKIFEIEPFTPTIITLGITPALTSLIAIGTIALKPAELRGMWLAVAGLVLSLAALAATALLWALHATPSASVS